jgi:hypothetical protein
VEGCDSTVELPPPVFEFTTDVEELGLPNGARIASPSDSGKTSTFFLDSIGGSMYDDCPECKLLSANLSEATKAYFVILEKRHLAQRDNDLVLVSSLETRMLEAVEKRGKARQDLRRHETTHAIAKGQSA